jgi:hypothetical protein
MIEVMKDGGGNIYKIPHIDKDRLEALGILSKTLSCDRQLYEDVVASLEHNHEHADPYIPHEYFGDVVI